MKSAEYHECMSSVYFTRWLLGAMAAAYAYENVTQPYEMWLVVAIAIFAVSNFICSCNEGRRAR